MMPKRKRTVSQDMGYDFSEGRSQEKRRSIHPDPVLDMDYEPGEIPCQEQCISMGSCPDYEAHPYPHAEISQSDCKSESEPQPVGDITQAQCEPCPYTCLTWDSDCKPESEAEAVPDLTQAQCKADPDDRDAMDYKYDWVVPSPTVMFDPKTGRTWTQYPPARLHPDVDLAMDNDYANDSLFLPSDSNMPHSPPPTMSDINPAPTRHTHGSRRRNKKKKPILISMPSGEIIKLHPAARIYSRSYYDDLTYNPSSTEYKFTTAAQLLAPNAFHGIGWSPEHYAGLTNTIAVPAHAATTPRPKPSSPWGPVRRTELLNNHDLAVMVGWMRKPITRMYQQGTGLVHPDFPTTWAGLALLTERQLDSIAEFYHQSFGTTPNRWWLTYPCPVLWRKQQDSVWVKRRKMMEFIGIRRAEKPPREVCRMLRDLEREVTRMKEEETMAEEEREEIMWKLWSRRGRM